MGVLREVIKHNSIYRGSVKLRVIRQYRLMGRVPLMAVRYFLTDPEITNFTYDISNRAEIASFVSEATGCTVDEAMKFIEEIDTDSGFHAALNARNVTRRHRKSPVLLGRRVGWYALVRLLKPQVVFEAGTSDGIGAATLGRAVQRNGSGRVVTFDIKDWTGWLVPDDLPVERMIGDSATTISSALERFGAPDMFIHDSDHRYSHELAEYRAAYRPGMVLLSDNAHAESALMDFAAEVGLRYLFVPERSRDHWFKGAGIGYAH